MRSRSLNQNALGDYWPPVLALLVLAAMAMGCVLNPPPTPLPTPSPSPTATSTPSPTATPSPAPTVAPTALPRVVTPVLKEWKNGLHGGKLIVSVVQFSDGTHGKAILYDSTRHYDHPWPDVCDGHEPAWSTWCGLRDWDAALPAVWSAKRGGTGQALKMGTVGGQAYAKFIEYRPGRQAIVKTCPNLPDTTEDGIVLKVLGTGCGESRFNPPPGL